MKFFKLVFLSSLILIGTVSAQKGVMKIEPSVVIAFPQSGTNTGFGLNGMFFYGINDNVDITGTLGYLSWGYSDWDGTLTSIPILFGGRYSFNVEGNITPYGSVELGFHFASFSAPEYNYLGQNFGGSSNNTEFGIGLGGGAYFKVGDNFVIDANLQYNTIGSGDYFAIEGGVIFGI